MTAEAATLKPDQFLQQTSLRITGIDFLRGLVMIIMALDHTRDFFHVEAYTGNPLDLSATTPALFITRWITHFCAPVFVFLSGVSAYLQGFRKTTKELGIFLIKRGLWLLIVEALIVNFGFCANIYFSTLVLQVIWATGISMIILGILIRLPFPWLLTIGLIITLGHNILDFWEKTHTGAYPFWYSLLHIQTSYLFGEHYSVFIFYPVLPWIGVILVGYCFGKLYERDLSPALRKKLILRIGIALIGLFILLRATELYGDPKAWSAQKNVLFSLFSFVNTQKYPPSLLYLCMTLGPALILLALTETIDNRISKIVTIYGSVPFFYYVLHFYLLQALNISLFLLRGHSIAEGMEGAPGLPFKFVIPGEGYGLGTVYLIWICLVLALYLPCKWFSGYKKRNKKWWLSYL